jgi:PAS domain S-box-containing protein
MMDEIKKLRALTEVLTGNGYLRDQAAEWEYALDAIPEFVYIIDTKHNLKFVNKILAERLGVSKEDLFNKKCYNIIKGYDLNDDGECLIADDCCDLDNLGDTTGEVFLENLNGWFVYDRSPIYTKTQKLIGFICILRDITERKKAEHAIERNEARLAAALELSMMNDVTEDEITDYVLEQAVSLTDSKIGYMHFVENSTDGEVNLNLFKWSKAVHVNCKAEKTSHYPLHKAGIWADCIRNREPVVHNDYHSVEDKKGLPEGHFPLHRHMSVPVMDGEQIVAVLGVGNKEEPYDDADIRQLSLFLNTMWDILKHKRLEQRFTDLINATPMGILTYDLVGSDLMLIHFNPEAEKILGMNANRCLGKCLEDVFPVLGRTEVPEAFRRVAKEGGTWDVDRFPYKDDSLGIDSVFSVNAYQVKQDQMAVLFQDVLEQEAASQALRDSEARYKQLFDIAPAGIYEMDYATGRFSNVNAYLCKYTGYTNEELLTISPFELLTEEGKQLFADRIDRVNKGLPISDEVEYEMVRKDGTTVWLSLTNNYSHDDEGNIKGATVVARDITEHKLMKQNIKSELKTFIENVDKSRKILIVEDQRVISELFTHALEDEGYDVEVASDGTKAVELIDANGICLVIVDLSLPSGPTGLEIIRKVAKEHCSVPILVVSGTGAVQDVDDAMRAGAWDYLAKPVELRILLKSVKRNLEQSILIKKSKMLDEYLELTN